MTKLAIDISTPVWAEPLLEPMRYKAAHGGRGSGKSHFFAELLVYRCLMAKTNAVCIREMQKSLEQSVKRLLESKIEALGLGEHFDCQQAKIICPHGGIIIFQGMQNHTAASIKSLEGFDIAWFEEASNASQTSLDLLRPTIRKDGSEMWFSWNPDLPTDPVDAFLRGPDLPPDSRVIEVNYRDNPWLPEVLAAEIAYDKRRDPDRFAHVWLGQYRANSAARVFSNWRIEECEPPAGASLRYGADFGFSVDPTVLLRCWIEGRNLYVDYEAYQLGAEIDRLPDLFLSVPEAEKWPLVADSSRPETISYLRNHGFPRILGAIKGPRSVEEGVEFLKSFDIIVHPRCVHLIDELALYSFKVDPLTLEVMPILADKDNHAIDALRYACEGIRRVKATIARRPRPAVQSAGWLS